MADIDYCAVFGIDGGGNERGAAAPAEDTGAAQGVKEQEIAAPAENSGVEDSAVGADGAADDDKEDAAAIAPSSGPSGHLPPEGKTLGGEQQPEQSPEERARFAAARRKAEAERDAAIQRAREEAQAEAQRTIDDAVRGMGITDPYTKKPITSKAEYDAYRAHMDAEKRAKLLEQSGMSEAELDGLIANHPLVLEAKQAQAAAEAAAREAREQQAKVKVEEQLREIHALDPSIKELKDLAGMENYQRFYELVKKGNTLTDAFKLANYDGLTQSAAAASRQAAINAAQSKQHLSQTTTRGAGVVSVPAEVKEAYRAFNPNATEDEIQKHYNRYLKN